MIDYKAISEAADMLTVAASCGIMVDGHSKALCPFHDDHKPSMQIYPDGYHCWVCGAHGDAIDFVERLRGCSKAEAAEEVARICGGEAYIMDDIAEKRNADRVKQEREYDRAFEAWVEADAQLTRINQLLHELTPYSAAWVYAQKERDIWYMRYAVADFTLLRMRCERYDNKHNRR